VSHAHRPSGAARVADVPLRRVCGSAGVGPPARVHARRMHHNKGDRFVTGAALSPFTGCAGR
ncbi:MAG: hypothetical protein WBC44_18915, partial [Planctomycetaceae bacterium]